MKKVFLVIFVYFVTFCLGILNVNADMTHVSIGNGASQTFNDPKQVCGEFNSSPDGNSSNSKQENKQMKEAIEKVCKDYKYYVLIFVDDSFSMNMNNKINTANQVIKKIIKGFQDRLGNKASDSTVKLCFFHGSSCSDNKNFNELNVNSLPGKFTMDSSDVKTSNTDIQKQLGRVYEKFSNYAGNHPNKVPIVFLVTDGYPTEISDGTDVTNKSKMDDSSGLGYLSTAKYFVRTIKSFASLKNSFKSIGNNGDKGKLVNVAIMNDADPLAQYFLNPNSTNKNNLSSGTSEASYLKSIIDNGGAYYETVAGVSSFPDLGLYHGKVTSDTKIKFEDLPLKSFKNFMSAKHCNNNSHCKFKFAFKLNKDPSRVKVRYVHSDDKTNFNEVSVSKIGDYYYFDISYDKKGNFGGNTGNNKGVFDLNKVTVVIEVEGAKFKSSDINVSNLPATSPVDNLFISENAGSLVSGIGNMLENVDCAEKKVYKLVKNPVNSKNINYSNNCIKRVLIVPSSSLYYSPSGLGKIFKIDSAKLEYYVCENLKYNFGTIDTTPNDDTITKTVYSGGGFKWEGTQFSNEIVRDYSNKNGDTPMVSDVHFSYIDDEDGEKKEVHDYMNYLDITSICTNSSCSSHYGKDSLSSLVVKDFNSLVKDENKVKDAIRNDFFKTIDTNDITKKNTSIKHLVKINSNIESYLKKRDYLLELPYAYSKDGTASFYEYSDTIRNGQDNLFRGQLRYVPLDYPTDDLDITVDGNFSSIDGIEIKVEGKCPIKVKQMLYPEDPKEPKKATYRYRSISLDEPFPKGPDTIPPNWKNWYADANNKLRLENSYQNKSIYDVSFTKSDINRLQSDKSYVDWSNIEDTGSSKFLKSSLVRNYVSIKVTNSITKGSYCPKGQFFEGCDKVRGGS